MKLVLYILCTEEYYSFFIMYLNVLAIRNCILTFFSQHIDFFLEVHNGKNKLFKALALTLFCDCGTDIQDFHIFLLVYHVFLNQIV